MKTLLNSASAVVCRLRTDEDGATALSFALGLTVMLSAIGVGMDFTIASKAHNKAQNIADSVALNAAVYVRENDDQMPNGDAQDAFTNKTIYTASSVGYTFDGLISDEVKLKVEYDMTNREATATVWGSTQTTFTNFLGYEKMPFESKSTVKFLTKRITAPASVFIVADNSGSMAWHDTPRFDLDGNQIDSNADIDGKARIVGLEDSVKIFMDKLEDVAGPQNTDDDKVVRTGLVPYSGSILSTQVDRDWGYLTDAEIEAMEPELSTNSSPPMTQVKTWMDTETQIHKDMHTLNPLRYVIFLTDGQNTGGSDMWVPFPGGGVWTGNLCEDVTGDLVSESHPNASEKAEYWTETRSVPTKMERITDLSTGNETYYLTWNWGRQDANRYQISRSQFRDRRRRRNSLGYGGATVETKAEGEYCRTLDAQTDSGNVDYNDVVRSNTDPALDPKYTSNSVMTEGKFVYDFDWETVETCNALRDDGVKVFSVGFALDPGRYKSNRVTYNREMYDQAYEPSTMTADQAAGAFQRASQLLQGCAYENTDDYFMLASDTEALEEAFEEIGQTISEEVVRLTR